MAEHRRGLVDQRDEAELLPGSVELLRHLEGHEAAKREAADEVGPARLDGAEGLDIVSGHLLDGAIGRSEAVEPERLETIEGLIRAELAGEREVGKTMPAAGWTKKSGGREPWG